MITEGFQLTKKNYKEIEYILNHFICDEKQMHGEDTKQKRFGIEVHFEYKESCCIFTFVDEIKICEWNDGIKVLLKSNGMEHSVYYYKNSNDVFSHVWNSGGGGKGDGSYKYTCISFSKPRD